MACLPCTRPYYAGEFALKPKISSLLLRITVRFLVYRNLRLFILVDVRLFLVSFIVEEVQILVLDDREQVLLRMICNEIFGENNFLAQFVWQKRTSPDMRKLVSIAHEYVCAYCKDISYLPNAISKVALSEEDAKNYKNLDNDPRGPWASSDFTAQGFRPNQMYEIIKPGGARYTPPEGRCWKNVESEFIKQRDEGRMWFGADGKGISRLCFVSAGCESEGFRDPFLQEQRTEGLQVLQAERRTERCCYDFQQESA